ncbi:MAG: PEP-CTERM sorting domain-containing protein [Planctomycetales bacterium]|nr:PEP-CTERM sorting domain-containing protein [Planctomycetales bacterium]
MKTNVVSIVRVLTVTGVVAGLLFAGLASTVLAQSQIGNFHITFNPLLPDPTGNPEDDGWENPQTGERWFFYPNAGTPWWNQWWYDDPPDPNRYKEIFYNITIESWQVDPGDPNPPTEPDQVIVALNWSNMQYPETGPIGPPPNADEEFAIERSVIFDSQLSAGEAITVLNEDPFEILEYNPEWVSIDVWVEYSGQVGTLGGNRIEIFGNIIHTCIPEPGSVLLLLVGSTGVILSRRRWG